MLANKSDIKELYTTSSTRLEKIFSHYLGEVPALELKKAMEYTLFNGGKRVRPMLSYATGCIFNSPLENSDVAACAIELIHTYSLIHDDLPCMDNADLRRGKPSCHKAFTEATAVLAGDGLLTLAFQVIAEQQARISSEKRVQMVSVLSKAAGPSGMVAGQMMDITLLDNSIPVSLLENIYQLKTGALFSAAVELGYLASPDDDDTNYHALKQFGRLIGFAFQIQDDINDIETETSELGKPQGLDAQNNKTTYPQLVGIPAAKDKVESLYEESLETINYLGQEAQLLRELVRYLLGRKS